MTCDQTQELLPEYLLGALDDVTDAGVRRHLRGCSTCRQERLALEEGLATLSLATHDHEPPEELRDRVLGNLADEWDEPVPATTAEPAAARRPARRRSGLLAVAASLAVLLVAGSIVFGATQAHRANLATADAGAYRNLLATLGGKEFRIGELHGSGGLSGQVLLYDGDPTGGWTSWGLVLVRGDVPQGSTATLLSPDGRTIELPPLHSGEYGTSSTWLVTGHAITSFDELTLTGPDGKVLATAKIQEA
ncbi:MAG: zf-HC2 domain-containing protein [Planctomycetaceae bacterium]